MKHGLQALIERLEFNESLNISFDSEELIDEVMDEIQIYGSDTDVIVWCDPKDHFIKDYFIIDNEPADLEEQEEIAHDKATFAKDKNSEDLYIVKLPDLLEALRYQDRII